MLPKGLRAGMLIAVNAPDIHGAAIGMYVVDYVPGPGEVHSGEALVLPISDFAPGRQLWVAGRHIAWVYPSPVQGEGKMPTAVKPPEPQPLSREAAYAARSAAVEAETKVPLGFASDAVFEFSRPDAWGGVAVRVQPVGGIGFVPAADRNRVLIHVTGARELTAPELKEADRLKAIREKEAVH